MSQVLSEREELGPGVSSRGARISWLNTDLQPSRSLRTATTSKKCGTTTGYKQGCRCARCTNAIRLANLAYRHGRRIGKGKGRDASGSHGRLSTYTKKKCRCELCKLTWRDWSRVHQRFYRHGTVIPERKECPTCKRHFWDCGAGGACSNSCYAKVWRERRRKKKAILDTRTPEAIERFRAAEMAAVATRAKADAALADLLAEQERDARSGDFISGWCVSLDALAFGDEGAERHELIGSDECDPAVVVLREEFAADVRKAIGDRTPEDVQRLDYATQEWLAAKLRDEGLVGDISVTKSERERLRAPAKHAGSEVRKDKGHGGKAKRREKVRAERHSHPSQKPRKRWSRVDWETAA